MFSGFHVSIYQSMKKNLKQIVNSLESIFDHKGAEVSVIITNSIIDHQCHGLLRCGGIVVQNPGRDTYCVVAGVENMRVKNLISSNQHDVVWAAWLQECLDRKEVVPWQPRHMIHMSPSTREHFAKEYDSYGDSYFADTDEQQLREVFARIGDADASADVDASCVEERYGWEDLRTSMFRPFRVYMDKYTNIGDPKTAIPTTRLDIRMLEFRFHGGAVVERLEEGVSHVVVAEETRLLDLRTLRRCFRRKFKIVRDSWVTDSITAGHLMDDSDYLV